MLPSCFRLDDNHSTSTWNPVSISTPWHPQPSFRGARLAEGTVTVQRIRSWWRLRGPKPPPNHRFCASEMSSNMAGHAVAVGDSPVTTTSRPAQWARRATWRGLHPPPLSRNSGKWSFSTCKSVATWLNSSLVHQGNDHVPHPARCQARPREDPLPLGCLSALGFQAAQSSAVQHQAVLVLLLFTSSSSSCAWPSPLWMSQRTSLKASLSQKMSSKSTWSPLRLQSLQQ